jgi:hypothetical protein
MMMMRWKTRGGRSEMFYFLSLVFFLQVKTRAVNLLPPTQPFIFQLQYITLCFINFECCGNYNFYLCTFFYYFSTCWRAVGKSMYEEIFYFFGFLSFFSSFYSTYWRRWLNVISSVTHIIRLHFVAMNI